MANQSSGSKNAKMKNTKWKNSWLVKYWCANIFTSAKTGKTFAPKYIRAFQVEGVLLPQLKVKIQTDFRAKIGKTQTQDRMEIGRVGANKDGCRIVFRYLHPQQDDCRIARQKGNWGPTNWTLIEMFRLTSVTCPAGITGRRFRNVELGPQHFLSPVCLPL